MTITNLVEIFTALAPLVHYHDLPKGAGQLAREFAAEYEMTLRDGAENPLGMDAAVATTAVIAEWLASREQGIAETLTAAGGERCEVCEARRMERA